MRRLKKILIVDDDPLFRVLTKEVVIDVGIANTIVEASDGAEGLDYLIESCRGNTECPELILLDNKMPEVDGLEFLKLKKDSHEISELPVKIVMLSSSFNKSEIERAKELGALEYIIKPLTEDKLKEVVERIFL